MKPIIALSLTVLLSVTNVFGAYYAVVSSSKTAADPEWAEVIDELLQKHDGFALAYQQDPAELRAALAERRPEYTCFVATPEEASREFVSKVHSLTRTLDADPYGDTIWGILTGFDAANALRIARHSEPLSVHNVASGTEFAMEMVDRGIWFSELEAGLYVEKESGDKPRRQSGPADSTAAIVGCLNEQRTDLFITSGHATERDWMLGFRYNNGFFKCRPGQLFAIDTQKQTTDIVSSNPKIYMPIGNCLMGHIDSRDAMALAWMNSAGVMQMLGYTVPTWYGYAGWGCLDYFLEQPGRYSFAEAVFANHQALLHRLYTHFPEANEATAADATLAPNAAGQRAGLTSQDARGLVFDRDVLAFYGDPAWQARMAPAPLPFEQSLTYVRDGDAPVRYTFIIAPNQGAGSFQTVNDNGSQRGGRPFFARLPIRIDAVEILAGNEYQPIVTENFILVPRPGKESPAESIKILFQGNVLERL
ncbi:MAG TPA: hypothetical protein DEW46_14990 [Verrucomicrobia bacterium]|jgi:zinc protease|nr:hypothetical protein [Verrucomicrobiota bacterium]